MRLFKLAFISISFCKLLSSFTLEDLTEAIKKSDLDTIEKIAKSNPQLLSPPQGTYPPLFDAFFNIIIVSEKLDQSYLPPFEAIKKLVELGSPLVYKTPAKNLPNGIVVMPLLPHIFNILGARDLTAPMIKDLGIFIEDFIDKKGIVNQSALLIEQDGKKLWEISTIFFALSFCVEHPQLKPVLEKLIEKNPSFLTAQTHFFSSDLSLKPKIKQDLLSFCCCLIVYNGSTLLSNVFNDIVPTLPQYFTLKNVNDLLLFLLQKVDPFLLLDVVDKNGKAIKNTYSSWFVDLEKIVAAEDLAREFEIREKGLDLDKILDEIKKWPGAAKKLADVLNTKNSDGSYLLIKLGTNFRFTKFLGYAIESLDLNFLKEALKERELEQKKRGLQNYVSINFQDHIKALKELILKKEQSSMSSPDATENLEKLATSLKQLQNVALNALDLS